MYCVKKLAVYVYAYFFISFSKRLYVCINGEIIEIENAYRVPFAQLYVPLGRYYIFMYLRITMDIFVDSVAPLLLEPFTLTLLTLMIVSKSCYTSHNEIIAMEKV